MRSTNGQYPACTYVIILLCLVARSSDALVCVAAGQQPVQAPLPDIRQLMREVQEHQRQLDQIRENYTYTSYQVVQDIDGERPGEEDGVV